MVLAIIETPLMHGRMLGSHRKRSVSHRLFEGTGHPKVLKAYVRVCIGGFSSVQEAVTLFMCAATINLNKNPTPTPYHDLAPPLAPFGPRSKAALHH